MEEIREEDYIPEEIPEYDPIRELKRRINEAERKLSDFTVVLTKMIESNVDYIAMETDVDLDQDNV